MSENTGYARMPKSKDTAHKDSAHKGKDDGWKGMHKGNITDPSLKKSRANRKTHAQRRADSVARNQQK